jgi:glyoxylase I family protein
MPGGVASSQRDRHWRGAAATTPRWDCWQNAGVIKGIHHLGFTVRDAEASAAWYVEVLGFRRVGEHRAPDGAFRKVFLRHDNLPSRIGLTEHRAGGKGVFDETRIGLDHLSFGVTDRTDLDAWVARLEAAGAEYSRIATANSIQGAAVVVFRDPDNIQLEIFFDPAWAEPA